MNARTKCRRFGAFRHVASRLELSRSTSGLGIDLRRNRRMCDAIEVTR